MTMTESLSLNDWPPAYRVKKHRLARHVKLRATKRYGLEITVPPRFNLRDLPAIIEEHKGWITKQLVRIQSETRSTEILPKQIHFHSLEECWQVDYVASYSRLELIERPQREIVLVGNIADTDKCKSKLTAWIKAQAKDYLMTQLKMLSEYTCLHFESVSIRDQQTLWGSCTSNKAISLNYKLIFLPQRLLRHVMIHELCHTRYLNHSTRFWNLVHSFDPDSLLHKNELRQAEQYIPKWL